MLDGTRMAYTSARWTPKSKVYLFGDDSNHANVINKTLIGKRTTEPEQVHYVRKSPSNNCDTILFHIFLPLLILFGKQRSQLNNMLIHWSDNKKQIFLYWKSFLYPILGTPYFKKKFGKNYLLQRWNLNKTNYMHYIVMT